MRTRPRFIIPSSPTIARLPPKGEGWAHEAKWDGYRCQIVKDGAAVRIFSRRGTEWTDRLPATCAAFKGLAARSAVLDGELCLCDASGKPDFRALHRQMRTYPDETRLSFHVFDVLHLNGADLRPKPLSVRRAKLEQLSGRSTVPCLYLVDQFDDGDALLKWCGKFGLEGIVSKRTDAAYVSGETRAWLKVKCPGWKAENRERWRSFEGSR